MLPGQYDAIVTVSGDGLLHEIINGLLRRKDWNTRVNSSRLGSVKFRDVVAVGAIPGGTGNGMVKSLLERGNENYGVKEAAFRILKRRTVAVDITELTFEYEP